VLILIPKEMRVVCMASVRPEVLAFVKATQDLLSSDTDKLPLSDEEMEHVAECLARVEQALEEGEI
jgi:hypothetical protein